MADNLQVHPTTEYVEKNAGKYINEQPSSQWVPRSSVVPEKYGVYHPSLGQSPRYYSRPPKDRNSFCRCLCCTIFFLFVLVAIIVIACGILYLAIQPKIPNYSVDSLRITKFRINADFSTNWQFAVNIRARNPNKKIGIYYLDNSHLAVSYSGTEVCTGALPVFYQGYKNTTLLDVALSGTGARLTSAVVSTLKEQQQKGRVPLHLKADVPVKIKLWKLKSMKIKVRVQWDLVVDKLDANAKVTTEKSKVSVVL